MTTMPAIRKNLKFFANGKNEPLVQLSTMIQDAEEIIAVLAVPNPVEFNTCLQLRRDLYPLLPVDSTDITYDKRYHERSIMYNRITLDDALRIEFGRTDGVYDIDADVYYQDPIPLPDFIKVLNRKFGYDTTTDDITLTHTLLNNYTITAKPNSLQYTGQASIKLGKEDDTPPPILIPSHDSVWNQTTLNSSLVASINGVDVDVTDPQALFNAGLGIVQYKEEEVLWLIWTGNLQGEATVTSSSLSTTIANTNVNETLKVSGYELYAKYVPFTPSTNIPVFQNPITAVDFKQDMKFQIPYAPSLDKIVGVWIDDVPAKISDLLKPAGVDGFTLVMDNKGQSTLTHDGVSASRVTIRVAIPSLPAITQNYLRFVSGITGPNGQVPLDSTGREVYNINFPARVVIVPEPSTILPMIPNNQMDYSAAMTKLGSNVRLNYTEYMSCTPTLTTVSDRTRLSATVESEKFDPQFPAFYFIKADDWAVIEAQPINTVLGTYTLAGVVDGTLTITVGQLLATTVPITNGRMLCIMGSIPVNNNASFKLNYQPNSPYYLETTTLLRFDIAYSKASLITPRELNQTILKSLVVKNEFDAVGFDALWQRQIAVQRFLSQIGSDWYASYEFTPFSEGPVSPSADDSGLYILQLFSIPAAAMVQIQGIAARKPEAVILTLVDSGGINTTTMSALDVIQNTVLQTGTGDGYLYFKHSKLSGATQVNWVFETDYDEADFAYTRTRTNFTITDSILDNPVIPFTVNYQECFNVTQYNSYREIVNNNWALGYLPYESQELVINLDSSSGVFTKFGTQTPAGYTVGRLFIPNEAANWLRDGDFSQFPETDPVVMKVRSPDVEVTIDILSSYLKEHAGGSDGIPIPLPLFDDQQRTINWFVDIVWFGYGNPPRPTPSVLPNLTNGSITTAVQNVIRPIKINQSLFNFTTNEPGEIRTAMRQKLSTLGKPFGVNDPAIVSTVVTVASDTTVGGVPTGLNRQTWYIKPELLSGGTHSAFQMIAIDVDIANSFLNGTFTAQELDRVIFRTTFDIAVPTSTDLTLTLRQVRQRLIIGTEQGYIGICGYIERVTSFGDPKQHDKSWLADYSVLNARDTEWDPRNVLIVSNAYLSDPTPVVVDLVGVKGQIFTTDIGTLASLQHFDTSFINATDLDIVSNNNFGQWNVTFKDKGKMGYEVIKLSTDAMTLIQTAIDLAYQGNILTVDVTLVGESTPTSSYTFTAPQLVAKLEDTNYFVVPLLAREVAGSYQYAVRIRFSYDNSTSRDDGTVIINNVTTINDETPSDLMVEASWTTPTTQAQLTAWTNALVLPALTLAQYQMVVTQLQYTHNVEVAQSNLEYPAALKIDKSVADRLIENEYPTSTIIGNWNGVDLTVNTIVNGLKDAEGNSILLVRAPVSLVNNNSYTLSISIAGILDYSQVFTGIDVPVVVVSDVIITAIQNNMAPLMLSLTNALNPIASKLLTKDSVTATITETDALVTNLVNNVSRDNLGKQWVIPVGISKAQVDVLTPGSWLVVRASEGLNITVNTDQLKQYATEGWMYTVGAVDYYVYPLLFTFENRDDVVKQTFNLDAGSSVGRWAPWFTNRKSAVNFEYSIRDAEMSLIDVLVPDNVLFAKLVTAGAGGGLPFITPSAFDVIDNIFGVNVLTNNLLVQPDDGKLLPLFVRFDKDQVDRATDTGEVSEITIVRYTKNDDGNFVIANTNIIDLTLAQIKASALVEGYYYYTTGMAVEGIRDFYLTISANVDYDVDGANWLSGNGQFGVGGIPAYNVDCTGALNYAGVVVIDDTGGSRMVTSNGVIVDVVDDTAFVNVLRNTFGLQVIELTEYVNTCIASNT